MDDMEYVLDKRLRLHPDFDGNLYKVVYLDPTKYPWIIYGIPGYCWLHAVDVGLAFSRSAMGRDAMFVGVVKFPMPSNMLNYFPSGATPDSGYSYFRDTSIKPGWLGNYYSQYPIADVAIVTIPQKMSLQALYVGGKDIANRNKLVGLEAIGEEGRSDDFDLWTDDDPKLILSKNFDNIEFVDDKYYALDYNVYFIPHHFIRNKK